MKEPSQKLQHRTDERTEEQAQLGSLSQQQQEHREFASVDELLRHDAANTPLPPNVSDRLRASVAREPAPRQPWWRRFWG